MRDLAEHYQLKSKASRDTMTEIAARFPTMFFSVHRLEQPKAKLGLKVKLGVGWGWLMSFISLTIPPAASMSLYH
jgi:hypothetical protein